MPDLALSWRLDNPAESDFGRRQEIPLCFWHAEPERQIAIALENIAILQFVWFAVCFLTIAALRLNAFVFDLVRGIIGQITFTVGQHPGIFYGTAYFLSLASSFIYADLTYGYSYGGSLIEEVIRAVREDARHL